MKCELCKVMNLIKEGKLHPSQTIWSAFRLKLNNILKRDPKSIASIAGCSKHNIPLQLNMDMVSAVEFEAEVFEIVERQTLARSIIYE